MRIRRTAAALTSAAALSVTGVAMATPAYAQPIAAGGLVNVAVEVGDVLSNNQVGVAAALQLAANVCDVNVNVLAQQLDEGQATCQNANEDASATITQIAD